MPTLNIITNGESGVHAISNVVADAQIMSWDDVLHDGPVKGGLPLDEFSYERARFLAACGWADEADVVQRLHGRDEQFREMKRRAVDSGEELVLWFEHDVYDQLQLLQILSELAPVIESGAPVLLVCHERFIGHSTLAELEADFKERRRLTSVHARAGKRWWRAVGSETPEALLRAVLGGNIKDPAFVRPAAVRLLHELPDARTGLSLSEWNVLTCLKDGMLTGGELFARHQEMEAACFRGDASFELALQNMLNIQDPLIVAEGDRIPFLRTSRFDLADKGRRVLAGEAAAVNDVSRRWVGGTYVRPEAPWYRTDAPLEVHRNPISRTP